MSMGVSNDEIIQDEIRQKLIQELKLDIIGPRKGPDEETSKNPRNEYVAGVLYPPYTPFEEQEMETSIGGDTDEDDPSDFQSAKDSLFKPSSFGLTCIVDNETDKLKLTVDFGIYQKFIKKQDKDKQIGRAHV